MKRVVEFRSIVYGPDDQITALIATDELSDKTGVTKMFGDVNISNGWFRLHSMSDCDLGLDSIPTSQLTKFIDLRITNWDWLGSEAQKIWKEFLELAESYPSLFHETLIIYPNKIPATAEYSDGAAYFLTLQQYISDSLPNYCGTPQRVAAISPKEQL